MEFLKGYRTIIFTVVMAGVMLVRALNPGAELPDEATIKQTIDAVNVALVSVWGVGSLILRAITTSSIFNRNRGS